MARSPFQEQAIRIVRVEMARRGIKHPELEERLRRVGLDLDAKTLRTKLARGSFSAAFFLQVLSALGVARIELEADGAPESGDPPSKSQV